MGHNPLTLLTENIHTRRQERVESNATYITVSNGVSSCMKQDSPTDQDGTEKKSCKVHFKSVPVHIRSVQDDDKENNKRSYADVVSGKVKRYLLIDFYPKVKN